MYWNRSRVRIDLIELPRRTGTTAVVGTDPVAVGVASLPRRIPICMQLPARCSTRSWPIASHHDKTVFKWIILLYCFEYRHVMYDVDIS